MRRMSTAAKSPVRAVFVLDEEMELVCCSSDERALIFNTAQLQVKTSRSTQGVAVMTLKPKRTLSSVTPLGDTAIVNAARYRVKNLPGAGAVLKPEDRAEQQLSLIEE